MLSHRRFDNESSRLSALLIGLFAVAALLLGITVYWIADRAMRAELQDSISADAGAIVTGYRSDRCPRSLRPPRRHNDVGPGAGKRPRRLEA